MPAKPSMAQMLQSLKDDIEAGRVPDALKRSIADTFKKQNPELLRCRLESYTDPYDFVPGQLVEWKRYMKNMRLPKEDDVAIVVDLVESAPKINPAGESGTTQQAEKVDVIVGLIDEDGDFVLFALNSNRLQPVASS